MRYGEAQRQAVGALAAWYPVTRSTSFFEPRMTLTRSCSLPGWMSRMTQGVMLAITLTTFSGQAHAQAWSNKLVRIIVPVAPGGSADPLARILAEELGRTYNQTFLVENRPGANGNIGAAMVTKAPPDGYTLLLGWAGTLVSAVTLYDAKPYHPQKDLDSTDVFARQGVAA